jgi:hypothetical protein
LRHGWTRFWASVSLALLVTAGTSAQTTTIHRPVASFRASESSLAGLLPGQTRLARARVLFGKPRERDGQSSSVRWNRCGDDLVVETDSVGVIETVRLVRHLDQQSLEDCTAAVTTAKWATGKGLRLGDSAARAIKLYGKPDSRSPSTKGGQRLELLYYAFDWAGPDVPQVMEVVCTVEKDGEPGRVVEITLAASSL